MTTDLESARYLNEHIAKWKDKGFALYNPHNKELDILPVIYGFNNGCGGLFYGALIIAEDGIILGSHVGSDEAYMPYDLGVLEGARPDRHEVFKKHYPDGYRMDFVSYSEIDEHTEIQKAFKLSLKESQDEA